jgi:hypothetical protein
LLWPILDLFGQGSKNGGEGFGGGEMGRKERVTQYEGRRELAQHGVLPEESGSTVDLHSTVHPLGLQQVYMSITVATEVTNKNTSKASNKLNIFL